MTQLKELLLYRGSRTPSRLLRLFHAIQVAPGYATSRSQERYARLVRVTAGGTGELELERDHITGKKLIR